MIGAFEHVSQKALLTPAGDENQGCDVGICSYTRRRTRHVYDYIHILSICMYIPGIHYIVIT